MYIYFHYSSTNDLFTRGFNKEVDAARFVFQNLAYHAGIEHSKPSPSKRKLKKGIDQVLRATPTPAMPYVTPAMPYAIIIDPLPPVVKPDSTERKEFLMLKKQLTAAPTLANANKAIELYEDYTTFCEGMPKSPCHVLQVIEPLT